jgi:hypothetical protein
VNSWEIQVFPSGCFFLLKAHWAHRNLVCSWGVQKYSHFGDLIPFT